MDEAYVTLQVDVDAERARRGGQGASSDPGNGFGRRGAECAMRQALQPALDHDGNPIAGPTKPFRVHFSR